jgi:hypothetical protein
MNGFPSTALADPKIAMSACYGAGMIGFAIFLAIGSGVASRRGEAAVAAERAACGGYGGPLWALVAIPG